MILLGLSMYPYLKIFGFVTALQFNIRSHLGGGGEGGGVVERNSIGYNFLIVDG